MKYKNWTELKLVKIIKLLNSEIMVGGAYDVIPSCAPTKVLIDVLMGLMVVILSKRSWPSAATSFNNLKKPI